MVFFRNLGIGFCWDWWLGYERRFWKVGWKRRRRGDGGLCVGFVGGEEVWLDVNSFRFCFSMFILDIRFF